jgi:signal transduction histidine kinase
VRRPLLTLKGKTRLLFVALGLLLAVTASLAVLQLRGIELDARRLLEETRESLLSSELRSSIHELDGQLKHHPDGFRRGAPEVATLRASLGKFRKFLLEFSGGSAGRDPSRSEHQAAEDRIVDRILEDLDAMGEDLDGLRTRSPAAVGGASASGEAAVAAGPTESGEARVSEKLDDALRYALVLYRETKNEAGRDNSDLSLRAEDARWMLWASLALAVAGFFWIGSYFIRHVAAPILELRDGAERLGRGDLGYRLPVHRRDEIGELASSFNEMAVRIGATHGELEASLAERTRDFLRAARFADLGVLAAGLAHEINNPLASIASSAEGLERRMARGDLDPQEASDYLRTIAAEAYRAKGITERLLALARPGEEKQGMVDLRLVLGHVEIMFRHQIEKRGLHLRLEGCEHSPWVHGNSEAYVQVFSNLLRNAEDASPRGGEIVVRCSSTEDACRVEVLDQGPGIVEADRERIFDPFFTTKAPGKGTGLGLAVVSSLLEGMGGRIEVADREGGGCRFTVVPAPVQGGAS